MKRKWIWLAAVLALTALLGGCAVLRGNYVSIEPHHGEDVRVETEITDVYNYSELQRILVSLVEDGIQRKVISVPTMNQSNIHYYMDAAINYITEKYAIGAYFVDEMKYELGVNAGLPAIVIDITYTQEQTQILRLNRVKDMDAAATTVKAALDACEGKVVFLVEDYQDMDFTALIRNHAYMYPQRVVEIPQVTVSTYPETGAQRVVELLFTYENDSNDLLTMQNFVRAIFTSARLYAERNTDDAEKYAQLYSFLMERFAYSFETTKAPAYHLLREGIGDSEAFACVYAAMCREVGLDCRAVWGKMDGKPRVWNALTIDGTDYYIDLLACYQGDGFCMMRQWEMGAYTQNPS